MSTSLQLSFYSCQPLKDKELLLVARGGVGKLVKLPCGRKEALVKLKDIACRVGRGGGGARGRWGGHREEGRL